jgi:hypothetical protein
MTDKVFVHIHLPLHHWQKPPHSQSEFIVFQKLSQWVVRVLQSSPRVPVQSFMVSINTISIDHSPLTFWMEFFFLICSNARPSE